MSSSFGRQHAGGSTVGEQPSIPEPTYGERARTLAYLGHVGSLSTLSQKRPGWPFASVMPYALDVRGLPLFLISNMAMHTQNILENKRAGLLITQPNSEGDPLGAPRVTLLGEVQAVPEDQRVSVRELYLARHPNARYWVDFDDFSFYQMEVVDVYFVGGFGVMGWITAGDYIFAKPDPLADSAPETITHINTDHANELLLIAQLCTDKKVEEAVMTSLDRLGFHVRLKSGDRFHGTRIAFPCEAKTSQEVRIIMIKMVNQAREQG